MPVIGIDIGQKHDPTAICVAEIDSRRPADADSVESRRRVHYTVRYLDRLPLGTPYPTVVERLDRICRNVHDQTGQVPDIFVDATGVGTPVVDLLRESPQIAPSVWAVVFTSGDRRKEDPTNRKVSLGKAYLVSRLQALFQCQRLHLPGGAESRALARELLNYEIRVGENATARYGAFRTGTHDDLVTAVGLAVQREP